MEYPTNAKVNMLGSIVLVTMANIRYLGRRPCSFDLCSARSFSRTIAARAGDSKTPLDFSYSLPSGRKAPAKAGSYCDSDAIAFGRGCPSRRRHLIEWRNLRVLAFAPAVRSPVSIDASRHLPFFRASSIALSALDDSKRLISCCLLLRSLFRYMACATAATAINGNVMIEISPNTSSSMAHAAMNGAVSNNILALALGNTVISSLLHGRTGRSRCRQIEVL